MCSKLRIRTCGYTSILLITFTQSMLTTCYAAETDPTKFTLKEFCGFRFGSQHFDSTDTNRNVEVKLDKPFRLFKSAELTYTSNDELCSVCLKLQDRMMSSSGIALPRLSIGATFGVTLEAMQEEHKDIVEWAESEYGIRFEKTKNLGEPARYTFTNENVCITVYRINMFGANQLSFCVSDARLLEKVRLAEQKRKDEKQKREHEMALRKNEFGRNKDEQAAFDKTVNVKTFWGFAFGEPFTKQPVVFDTRTIKKNRSVSLPRGKLQKPFFQVEDVTLHIDRATSNLTMVSMKKTYSEVPPDEQRKLSRQFKYERPGLYDRQKEIVDWFSKEYKIVFEEDKIYRTFSFRNDCTFIQIKRSPYNDTIEILVSGNKTPAKKKSNVTIPATSLDNGAMNLLSF